MIESNDSYGYAVREPDLFPALHVLALGLRNALRNRLIARGYPPMMIALVSLDHSGTSHVWSKWLCPAKMVLTFPLGARAFQTRVTESTSTPYGPVVVANMSCGNCGERTKNGGPGTRVTYPSIMTRVSPNSKYQFAMDIQVISTLLGPRRTCHTGPANRKIRRAPDHYAPDRHETSSCN